MSHLFWLDQRRLNRIKHMVPKPRGLRVSITSTYSAASSMSFELVCVGEMRRLIAGHTRRFSTEGLDGP